MNRDGNTTENYQFVEPGLYNTKQIIDIIRLSTPWVELSVNYKLGTLTLVLKKERKKMKLQPELADLLGLSSSLLGMGTYVVKIDLQSLKSYIFIAIKFPPAKIFTTVDLVPYHFKRFTYTR